MICEICPRGCHLSEGQTGFCKGRQNINDHIVCTNYGLISSMALDPIEKKPLFHFHPGHSIFSIGSYGCNMYCPFCQNSSISQYIPKTRLITPEQLVKLARLSKDNLGVAFTYNEPLISMEYLLDSAPLLHEVDLNVVAVTNGYVTTQTMERLLPHVDAMNIDVKGFTDSFYQKVGGNLEQIKHNVEQSVSHCHVEITTLIIPGENDSDEEIDALTRWLASVSPDIPYHMSRFFPHYYMKDKEPTPIDTLERLAEIARSHLRYVYIGNV